MRSVDTILTVVAAAVFGYFEQLLQSGDPLKVAHEMLRLKEFASSFHVVGFELDMVEMFMDSAMQLLEKMREALLQQNMDETFLLQIMNDPDESNSIVYYFKVCESPKTGERLRSQTPLAVLELG
jgi:uncharacterized protein YqgV (UPF0045/DUF77 family)